jgi:sugar phosphate isomerase/epimerase
MKTGIIGHPVPESVPEAERFDWLIDRCADLGVDVAHGTLASRDRDDLARLRDHAASRGVELETTAMTDYVTEGVAAREARQVVLDMIEDARQLGLPILRTIANNRLHSRFTDPPLVRQLELYAANLRELAGPARDAGVTLAIENHCDYRGSEIAELIERVDSPAVRAALDTGNGYTVFDEPMADVRALAKYSVTTHFKDMKIVRFGEPGKVPWLPVGCALGQGHVDLEEAARILAAEAPDPASLRLIVEINWPPGGSTPELFEESVRFLKERLGQYLG